MPTIATSAVSDERVGLATIVVAFITLDGETHWFEGVQLLAVYALIGAAAYFI